MREVPWAFLAVGLVFGSVVLGMVMTRIGLMMGLYGVDMFMYPASLVVGVALAARLRGNRGQTPISRERFKP
jgi:hypothetical protein